jgi:hypothetical protein
MEESQIETASPMAELKCKNCGARLEFAPGTSSLECKYCGEHNEIEIKAESIEELDFEKFVKDFLSQDSNLQEVKTIKCEGCGSETTMDPKIVSDSCSFCGSTIQISGGSTCKLIRPKSVLPFKVKQEEGLAEFKKWINGRWFAPSDLKKYAKQSEKLAGVYIPYWTYDSDTRSEYTGQRGVDRTETYTAYEDGKSVTKTRTVTDWYYASGTVYHSFDDVLVLASESLPKKNTEALEPWDLEALIPFDEKFLSGFKAESYAVDLPGGWEAAKVKMDPEIRRRVCSDIGGDHQRIHSLVTNYSKVTFKHLLLPVWISAFRYREKSYRFLVNGRTGEVQGERPYSGWKIFFFVLLCLAVVAGIVLGIMAANGNL